MDSKADPATTVQPTIDYDPSASEGPTTAPPSASAGGPAAGRVQVVAGSGVHLSEETRSLLRARLRAVALAMSCAFGAFLLRDLWLSGWGFDPWIRGAHVALIAAFLASFLVFSGRRPISLRRLRALELVLFGMMIAFFAAMHYRIVLQRVAQGDRVMLMATVKNSVLFVFSIVVLYGMFIPNTWRRAAAVAAAMAVAPLLIPASMSVLHPEVLRFAAPLLTPEILSENLLMLAIGVCVTAYSAHVINALRVEEFGARQLNQYRLKERLGAGGMGVVYLAEHRMLKRPCAIKLVAPDRAGDARALARFEREVRATARLSHPNTVEIYDYGRTDDGTFYYAMELLSGLSFAELVERHGPLPPGRAVFLLRQACGALAEAHAAGLVHRDLKPANLFAARRGPLHDFAKVLDFGLVLHEADPSPDGPGRAASVAGSPLYMAPEQAAGTARLDARTDLYGLGSVAYFLLTGRPPFAGATAREVMVALARDPVVPPSHLRPGLPPDLERVVLRCLARSPADRPPDAEALEGDLAACASASEWDFARAADWWRRRDRLLPEPMPANRAARPRGS